MNRTLGTIVLVLCLIGCKKRNSAPIQTGGNMVTQTFGGLQDDLAMDILVLGEKIYVLGNTQSFGNGQTDVIVVCYSFAGEELWFNTYGGPLADEAIRMISTSDGNLLIAGYSNNGTNKDGYLVKVDPNGKPLWEKKLDKGFDEELSGCSEMNGFFYLTGNQTQTTNSDMWLLKTDLQGNEVWSRYYGGPFDDKGRNVIGAANGNLLSWAMTYNYGQGDRELWLFEFNQNGDSVTSVAIGTPAYEQPGNIIMTSGGNYVFTYHTAGSDPTHDLGAHAITASYQTVWKIDTGTTNHEGGEDVCETSSGYVFLGNQGHLGAGQSDVYLLYTDKNGNPTRTQTIALPGEQWLKAATYHNGWLYMAVSDKQASDYDVMLVMMRVS